MKGEFIMNISTVYSNRHLIPEEHVAHFEKNRKTKLNMIEKIGLEAILCEFVKQYEMEAYWESVAPLRDFTRWNEDSIDILDGYYDTYVFDGYAISEIWIAYESCVMLSCYKLEHDEYDDENDILRNTDWQSECEPVLFRLD